MDCPNLTEPVGQKYVLKWPKCPKYIERAWFACPSSVVCLVLRFEEKTSQSGQEKEKSKVETQDMSIKFTHHIIQELLRDLIRFYQQFKDLVVE